MKIANEGFEPEIKNRDQAMPMAVSIKETLTEGEPCG
jgi:hypothetical protein